MSSSEEPSTRPRSADADFLERLAELDRDLPVTEPPQENVSLPAANPAERLRSSAMAPRDPRPLIDLFAPVDEPEASIPSQRALVGVVAALGLLVAAGATAAAFVFRQDLAAMLAAWQVR